MGWKPAIVRKLSAGDKEFIKLIEEGSKKAPAFRQAYPEHEAVIKWKAATPRSPERQKYSSVVIAAAKTKLQAQYMRKAIMSYQDSMEEFSQLSIDTAIELVQSAKSEKVRADLAVEGIRHKIGTPVQKVAVNEKKTVVLTFGEPPKELEERTVIDVTPIEKEAAMPPILDDIFN